MPYPLTLGGTRSQATSANALIQIAADARQLDQHVRAWQHAYSGVLAAEFEAAGAAIGSGAVYAQLNADLLTFLGTPAWTRMMQYVDQLCDMRR
jgi:hypothetical protein